MKDGNEELYDYKNDPEENVNLAEDPDKMRKKFELVREKAQSGLY